MLQLTLILFLSFCLGASFGSFALVAITRYHKGTSFLSGRSYCDACHHVLSPIDLVPVFSFLFLKGKCRYCHVSVSLTYVLFEIALGILFCIPVGMLLFLSPSPLSPLLVVGWWGICIALVIIFFSDIWYGIIPDYATILIGIIGLLNACFITHTGISALITGLCGGFFFFALYVITRGRGMGLGDVKYVVAMGFLLMWQYMIIGLYIAFIVGAIVALGLVLLKRKKLHGSTIPFGPFLVIGTLAALIYGDVLWKWYLSFL